MTRTDVNDDIDLKVTDKTPLDKVQNTEDGANRKYMLDYTDQQDALKEDLTNKSTNVTTDGASDTKYPSVKAVKTYVDANAVVQVVKVQKTTITSAQILALFDTPIIVLDSSEAGKIRLPLNIWVQRQAGDAYTLAVNSFLLVNDAGTNVSGNLNPNPLTGTSIGFFTSTYNISQNNVGADKNNLYKLKASTGNPTGGTGNIDVYMTYIEFDNI